MTRALSTLGLDVNESPRFRKLSVCLLRSDNGFEGLLTLALLQMPRLSRLRLHLHPWHGHIDRVYTTSTNGARSGLLARVHVFEVLIEILGLIAWKDHCQPGKISFPPSLQSLQTIEVTIDPLHDFNRFQDGAPAIPLLRHRDIDVFLLLPRLTELLLTRHPKAPPLNHQEVSMLQRRNALPRLTHPSPIEELVLVGFGSCQEYIRYLVRNIQQLHVLVLQH